MDLKEKIIEGIVSGFKLASSNLYLHNSSNLQKTNIEYYYTTHVADEVAKRIGTFQRFYEIDLELSTKDVATNAFGFIFEKSDDIFYMPPPEVVKNVDNPHADRKRGRVDIAVSSKDQWSKRRTRAIIELKSYNPQLDQIKNDLIRNHKMISHQIKGAENSIECCFFAYPFLTDKKTGLDQLKNIKNQQINKMKGWISNLQLDFTNIEVQPYCYPIDSHSIEQAVNQAHEGDTHEDILIDCFSQVCCIIEFSQIQK
jgi:hypothetical protein